ncbi:hypothetical protein SDC9_173966 [bioreactor metagenome]|uniref:Uncharacterized protein n=1 Tax=bioreactor metagenome TaxID=1076179 RepID=A0A645GHT7_9ZZZZ
MHHECVDRSIGVACSLSGGGVCGDVVDSAVGVADQHPEGGGPPTIQIGTGEHLGFGG